MAKKNFKKGDRFSFNGGVGAGIALSSKEAVLIHGRGGHISRIVEKGKIPSDARPNSSFDYDVKLAMDAVEVAIS